MVLLVQGEEEDLPPPLERVEEEDLVPRIEGKVEDSPFSVIGLNPWSNSDRRMMMCNELAMSAWVSPKVAGQSMA